MRVIEQKIHKLRRDNVYIIIQCVCVCTANKQLIYEIGMDNVALSI